MLFTIKWTCINAIEFKSAFWPTQVKKKSDVLSSMVTHTRNWCSAFNPSKCTHTAVGSEHTPGAVGSHCSSARGAVGGSVPCSNAPQSWYWRWRECCSFTIPTFNPCRTWDSNPQPLDYKSDSLTNRPRLPAMVHKVHLYMQFYNYIVFEICWMYWKTFMVNLNIL